MAETATDPNEIPPAMDYAMHERTYEGFLAFVKWGVVAMGFIVLSLYCFIQAGQPLLGAFLLVLMPIVVIAGIVMSRKSA